MGRCKIYKNLWAGYDLYLVPVSGGRMISVHNAYREWRVNYSPGYTRISLRDTEHYPVVGEVDIDQAIISAVLAGEEEHGQA